MRDDDAVEQAVVEELPRPVATSGGKLRHQRTEHGEFRVRRALIPEPFLPRDFPIDRKQRSCEPAQIVDPVGANGQSSLDRRRIGRQRKCRSAFLRLVRQQLLHGQRARVVVWAVVKQELRLAIECALQVEEMGSATS